MMDFNEHHRWKDIMWVERSYPDFPTNLEILDGSLVSLINWLSSWILKWAMKDKDVGVVLAMGELGGEGQGEGGKG